jgi:hypothetical protein
VADLLERVLDAHGGLDNWSTVTSVRARLSLDGPFWDWRGWPQIRQQQTVTLDPRREHITFTPFVGITATAVFDAVPERVLITDADGHVLHERHHPRSSFPAYHDTVRWDALHLAYFTGAANWNYFTAPFLFTYPGVETHEIDSWQEDHETWRRLAVTFPPNYPNHNAHQTFYYDRDYLLRRMDYAPDVTGNSPIAHYTHDPQTFDGFTFYTRRQVHLRNAEGVADHTFTPITIGIESVSVERHE